jgi:pimeloyl-ACP methyl ester carboxylesterase
MRNGRTALLALILAAGAACTRQETPAPAAPTEATPAPAPAPPASAPPLPQAAPREARIPSLAPDAARIRYRVYGSGEPAIVFIHGWSCDSGYWDAQLNHFAARHTVITVDLAGHGESATGKRGDWSPANFGADVAAAVLDVGPQRVVLVGSSMGGTVALEAARRLPGRVIGVVGVDTFRDIATPFPKELVDGLLASLRADFSKGITGFVGGNFFTERSDPILKRWIVEDMAAAPPEVAIPALEAYVGMDYGPLLAELDLPIVAVNAAPSPTDEAATRALEPRFRAVALPDAGHFPMLEDPGAFNRVLDRIVAEWVAREPARKPLSADAPAG